MDWAGRIKALRDNLGLSRDELAVILNVSYQTVHRWENGLAEPAGCDQALVSFVEENQQGAEELLSIPITATSEEPSIRIRRLREELGLSRAVFGTLLNVTVNTIFNWEAGNQEPSGCSLRLLDLLEFHREKSVRYLWPQLASPEAFATLKARRDGCKRFVQFFLETQGAAGEALLASIEVDDEWSPDRVVALRETLGVTVVELSDILGTSRSTVNWWSEIGLPENNRSARCWRVVLTIFERYPQEMMALRKTWPMFI